MTRRTSIYVEEFRHRNPVPAACRIGQMVYSGGIHGRDPETGGCAEGLERQCALMFSHVRSVVAAAGGTPEDIVKMTFWMQDPDAREAVNAQWEAMFPDPASRPTRHAVRGTPRDEMLVQCDFVAILPGA